MTGHRLRALAGRQVEQVGVRLRRRMQHVQDRELAQARLRHGNHYLIRPPGAPAPPQAVRDWPTRSLGDYTYAMHPGTSIALCGGVALIGQPIDISASSTDPTQIAQRLASTWSRLDTGGDPDGAVEQLAREAVDLGGRWVLVLHHAAPVAGRAPITVLTDAQASVPVVTGAGTTPALASDPRFLSTGDVQRVPANRGLRLVPDAAGARVSLRPCWTVVHRGDARQAVTSDPDALQEAFRARLVEHVRLLTTLGPPVLSLTGGLWSRATLAAYLPHRRPGELAYTVYDPESARTSPGPATDLFAASELALQVGLPHRVLRPGDDLGSLLPAGAVELRSVTRAPGADPIPLVADETHEVLLPFNDRVLWQWWLTQPEQQRADRTLLRRLTAELPQTQRPPLS